MNDLLTLDDIAAELKLLKTYVRDRLVKRPDFPRPCLQISQKNRRWKREDLRAWQEKHEASVARKCRFCPRSANISHPKAKSPATLERMGNTPEGAGDNYGYLMNASALPMFRQ